MKKTICFLMAALLMLGIIPLSFADESGEIILMNEQTVPGTDQTLFFEENIVEEEQFTAAETEEPLLLEYAALQDDEVPAAPAFQDYPLQCGITGSRYSTGITYGDSMLLVDNTDVSPDLAKLAMGLAAAAYVDVGDTPESLYETLRSMGYTPHTEYGNYYREHTVNDNDFARYTIASKPIDDGGDGLIAYLVIVQGTRGGYDWNSNFNIGDGEDHAGFYLARREIIRNLCSIMEEDGDYSPSHRIVLTTGHSRGAAVSNIIAGELTAGSSSAVPGKNLASLVLPENVFSYNFACPAVSRRTAVKNTNFRNIFNFNNNDDIIPILPMGDWGYVRYGIDNPAFYDSSSVNFKQRFNTEKGRNYTGTQETTAVLGEILNNFIPNVSTANQVACKALFRGVAFLMRDGNSLKDFLESVGVFAGENLLDIFRLYVNGQTEFSEITDYLEKADTLAVQANSCLADTEGMSEEEFTVWLGEDENRARVEFLENETGYDIKSRRDLISLYGLAAADTIAGIFDFDYVNASTAEKILEGALALWMYFTSEGRFNSIGDAHEPLSYVLSINSMFYGYKGWYAYPIAFGVWLNEEDGVTAIGEYCFQNSNITILQADDQFRHVGNSAFSGCSSFQEIQLGESLMSIGKKAFYNCTGITELEIPETVESIGDYAFAGMTGLTDLTLPVEYLLSQKIFYYKSGTIEAKTGNLTNLHVAKGKTGVMEDLTGPNSATLPYMSAAALKTVILDEGIRNIGEYAFYKNVSSNSTYTINMPSTVTKIGQAAFNSNKCTITGDVLPAGLTELGRSAFYGTTIKEITIPAGLKSIPENAFYNCTGITELEIPETVESIGDYAFAGMTGLTDLTLPVEYLLSQKIFYYKSGTIEAKTGNLTNLHVTKGKTGVMEDLTGLSTITLPYMSRAALKTVILDEGIRNIGDSAFHNSGSNNNIYTINMPSTVTKIGEYAFYSNRCTITGDVLPAGLTELGRSAFYGTTIKEITIPAGLKSIPENAFIYCTGITELEIPETVESIGDYAFAGMTGLTDLTLPVEYLLSQKIFYYKNGTVEYKTENLTNLHVTKGKTGVMEDLTGLSTITLPYMSRAALKTVILDEGIRNIGDSAFHNSGSNNNIYTINMPSTVTKIGEYAFYSNRCTITGDVLPAGLTELGRSAFANRNWTESPTIPGECISIGTNALYGISVPINVYPYSAGLEYVKDNSLQYSVIACNTMTLPNLLSEIEEEAFTGIMTEIVVLPKTITRIGPDAFAGSTVQVCVFNSDAVMIDETAFDGCESLRFACDPESRVAQWAAEHSIPVTSCKDAA